MRGHICVGDAATETTPPGPIVNATFAEALTLLFGALSTSSWNSFSCFA